MPLTLCEFESTLYIRVSVIKVRTVLAPRSLVSSLLLLADDAAFACSHRLSLYRSRSRSGDLDGCAVQSCFSTTCGSDTVPLSMASSGFRNRIECSLADILDWSSTCSVFSDRVIWGLLGGLQIVGWAGFVRVDGTTYTFLGTPGTNNNAPTQQAVQKSLQVGAYILPMSKKNSSPTTAWHDYSSHQHRAHLFSPLALLMSRSIF